MAVAPLNKFLTIAIPVAPGEQTIYTAPTGTSAIVLYAQVSNVGIGQSYPSVTFTHRRTSVATRTAGNIRNNRLIKDGEVPPNDALILIDGRLVLERTAVVSDAIVISGIQSGITTVTDAQYDNISGVTTVTTLDPHKFSVDHQVTMTGIAFTCPSIAGITSAIFPAPQAAFTITNVVSENGNVGLSKTFVVNTGIVKGLPHTYRAAIHRFVRSEVDSVDVIGGDTLKPTAADYDPISGIVSFTANYGTGLVNPGVTTAVTGTSYDPSTGVLTVETQDVDNGWQTGDLVLFEEGALTFRCAKDSNTSDHTYPRVATGGAAAGVGRTTDPVFGKFIPVTRVNDNRFTCNVGVAGPNGQHTHTFQSGAERKIKRHPANLSKSKVGLATEGFVFKCSQDNYLTEHKYPRTTDPSHWGSSGDELGVNTPGVHVAVNLPWDNAITITDTSENTTATPQITAASYNPSNGELTLNIGAHSYTQSDTVKFAVNSLKFTCDMDGNSSTKTYPRTTDPVYNKNIPIKSHSSPNITVDVGKVNQFSVHVGVSTAGGLVGPLQMELICSILENSTAQ